MHNHKWFYIAKAVACIAVSAAVIAGIYITKSANCLWGLIFMPSIYVKNNKEEQEDEN